LNKELGERPFRFLQKNEKCHDVCPFFLKITAEQIFYLCMGSDIFRFPAISLAAWVGSLVPRRFGLFTCARGTAREGEKRKIRREAPGRIRIQNGGSVFCKCSVLFILLLKWHCLQQNTGSYIASNLWSAIFNLNF
jgi:hypothetical protein